MPNRGKFIGSQDNLYVPDAPTIGDASAGNTQVSVAFTAPSDVGNDAITAYGASVTDGTNVIGATGSSSPVTVTGLTNGTSYTAQVWAINDYGNGPLSAATSSFSPALDRILYAGGRQSSTANSDTVQYINGSSTGNATDFGNLSAGRDMLSSVASSTRGVVGGGKSTSSQSAVLNIVEYFTFASTGNATDLGDLTVARDKGAGFGSGTRGIFAGGKNSSNSEELTIDYVTIASVANAIDFGDIAVGTRGGFIGGFASPTRGVFAGGYNQNIIQYLTIASLGNTSDFGDLTVQRWEVKGCSTSTRGLFMGGWDDSTRYNVIDYVTIASTGNATDFGNLSADKREGASASNSTRGMYFGGETSSTQGDGLNVIEYVTIASTGDVTDFGDLLAAGEEGTACSSTHGGIA